MEKNLSEMGISEEELKEVYIWVGSQEDRSIRIIKTKKKHFT